MTIKYAVAIVGSDDDREPAYCRELVACKDEQAVRQTTLKAEEYGREWSIYELVDGRFEQRSMVVTETVVIS